MRNVLRLVAVPFAASVALLASSARADLAPPPNYVESCTIENAPKDQECHRCGAFFGNRTWCSDELASYGFSQQCRTRGASVWGEIWCRPKAATNKAVPKEVLAELGSPKPKAPAVADAGPPPAPTASASASETPSVAPSVSTGASASSASSSTGAPPAVPPKQGCGACDVGTGAPLSALALAASAGLALTLVARRRQRP